MKETILNWCTKKSGVLVILIFANLIYLMLLRRDSDYMNTGGQMYIFLKFISVGLLIAYYILSKAMDKYLNDDDYFSTYYPTNYKTQMIIQNHFWRLNKGYDIPSVLLKALYHLSILGAVFYFIFSLFSIDNFNMFTNLCVPYLLNAVLSYIILSERKEYLSLKERALYNWVLKNDKEGKIKPC